MISIKELFIPCHPIAPLGPPKSPSLPYPDSPLRLPAEPTLRSRDTHGLPFFERFCGGGGGLQGGGEGAGERRGEEASRRVARQHFVIGLLISFSNRVLPNFEQNFLPLFLAANKLLLQHRRLIKRAFLSLGRTGFEILQILLFECDFILFYALNVLINQLYRRVPLPRTLSIPSSPQTTATISPRPPPRLRRTTQRKPAH